ncbi:hypothetical protein FNV43_RR15064 [Rhamnella rubrinervis]|uniref:Uncharacterized protein n=1 Tax=Rhamnella rubrinervis TaxID=2594499 RepID=A0A8K0E727_9ROSA|nr:hypothetical protein FNV43_RR15064 [Rhamnella rubrinervis]
MGDFLGSLIKLHTVGCMVVKLGTISVERNQGSLVEGIRPNRGPGGVAVVSSVVSEPIPSRKCADKDIGPLWGVDCDDLSWRVARGIGRYLVSSLILPRWWRKGLIDKMVP